MSDPNPYEPPQSLFSRSSSETPRAAGSMLGRYLIPSLIGLQIASGSLAYLFHVLQALAHSGYQRLQMVAEIFAFGFLGLGLLVFLIALIRGSVMLLIGEVIALGLFFWWTLPAVY